ncbi:hypothetical protein SAMN04487765_2641 [Tenacibaculum sp. MAR_2010_89]|nr:hypothetical protein SAMN04487765_2641 [Tenacibaculum sp. MAR_2010_89]
MYFSGRKSTKNNNGMPFIEEEKYQLMQEDFDKAKLKREESEKELSELQETYKHHKQKSRTIYIILGLFLGLALGIIYLFKSGKLNDKGIITNNKVNISEIKAREAERVIDSLKRVNKKVEKEDMASVSTDNLDDTINEVESNVQGKTIYSVQLGVFQTKKYPLLSNNLIPGIISSKNGYFKYSLGLFSTLNEAKYFKKELAKIGFKDAFVASYINNKRQKIHH